MRERENGLSRREFLRLVAQGASMTVLGEFALRFADFGGRRGDVLSRRNSQEEAAVRSLESGELLEVRYFAKDIADTSSKMTPKDGNIDLERAASSFLAMVFGNSFVKKYEGFISDNAGALSVIPARAIDLYSTIVATKYMADPRFKEYGLDVFYYEGNLTSSANPTPSEILSRGLPMSLVAIALGRITPSVGFYYLGLSPFIGRNNLEIANIIKLSLQLGDGVNALIKSGRGKEDIKEYLAKQQSIGLKES